MVEIQRNDLGYIFHTATRKCMDSTQSVAVWNLINVLPQKVWILYLDTVWEAIKDKPDNYMEVIKQTSCNWVDLAEDAKLKADNKKYHKWRDEFKKGNGYCYAYTLEAIFKLFTEQDWYGYCYWLKDE